LAVVYADGQNGRTHTLSGILNQEIQPLNTLNTLKKDIGNIDWCVPSKYMTKGEMLHMGELE